MVTIGMDRIREESDKVREGYRPVYYVVSDHVGIGLLTSEAAIEWHNFMLNNGVFTKIIDLRDYDWDTNPAGFRLFDTSTSEGQKQFAETAATWHQTTLN